MKKNALPKLRAARLNIVLDCSPLWRMTVKTKSDRPGRLSKQGYAHKLWRKKISVPFVASVRLPLRSQWVNGSLRVRMAVLVLSQSISTFFFFSSCQTFTNKYSTKNMHYLQVVDAPLKQPWEEHAGVKKKRKKKGSIVGIKMHKQSKKWRKQVSGSLQKKCPTRSRKNVRCLWTEPPLRMLHTESECGWVTHTWSNLGQTLQK